MRFALRGLPWRTAGKRLTTTIKGSLFLHWAGVCWMCESESHLKRDFAGICHAQMSLEQAGPIRGRRGRRPVGAIQCRYYSSARNAGS